MSSDGNTYLANLIGSLKDKFNIKESSLRGLGVYLHKNSVYLYYQSKNTYDSTFHVAKSRDGFNFNLYRQHLQITNFTQKENILDCSDFHILKIKNHYLLTYKKNKSIRAATSTNLLRFEYDSSAPTLRESGIIVPDITFNRQYVMYTGERFIYLALSKDLKNWAPLPQIILKPRLQHFDCGPLKVEHVMLSDKGILVIYHSKITTENGSVYKVGAALFDKKSPTKLLWRTNEPVWEIPADWHKEDVRHIGVVNYQGTLISYWGVQNKGIFAVVYSLYKLGEGIKTKNISLKLKRVDHNPIISPKQDNHWEAFTTFNPAALYEDGKVHLLYRAQGYNYVSVLGYASSSDGYNIDQRHIEPAYLPTSDFEYNGKNKPKHISHFYMSGGGYGGCEDPRLTKIDDKIYMTYVAYDGWSPPRVALTSISVKNFLNHRWLWERPVIISPPGVVDKNAVIFPEKINGKYVIMHRVYPDILIDYVDTLNFDGTWWLKGEYKISPRPTMWDSRKIGAGAPPIKTKDGWLLIYQSVGNQDPGRYKIGAMLLDLNNPTKVLHRANAPILEPDMRYENEGFKAGVVYPCGAVVIGETLFVYYGGADSYVCVATANLNHFLDELKYSELAKLEPAIISQVM